MINKVAPTYPIILTEPRTTFTGDETEEIKRLRSTHPYYDRYIGQWEFFEQAYSGGVEFAHNNIFKHQRENPEDYEDRVKRAHNYNYSSIIIDFYTNFIFSDVIERSFPENEELYAEFLQNVNKKGDSIDQFMANYATDARIYGMSFLYVDMPTKNPEVVSKQQEEDLGIKPYWILIRPDEVLDWQVDDFDNYLYVKRKQYKYDINLETGEKKELEIFTEFYQDKFVVTKVDVTDIRKPEILSSEVSPNQLGAIPLVCLKYKRSRRYPDMGDSFLTDIAYTNREILNINSLIDEFLYRQAFNMLAKESEGIFNLMAQDEGVAGTSNVVEYPKGGNPPQYVSPPADPAKFLQSERQNAINEIFRQAVQDLRSDLANGEQSSGFSQAQSFSRTVPFISIWAEQLENAENKAMKYTMMYLNKKWVGRIKYKDHYEITSVADSMTHLLSLFKDLALPSETFAKVELKRLVAELDGKLSSEDKIQVMKEIDELDFEEWQENVRSKGTSPLAQQKPQVTPMTMEEATQTSVKQNVGSMNKMQSEKKRDK